MSAGSSCPGCGATKRRFDQRDGTWFCTGCGREYEPYSYGDEELDPLIDAVDRKVKCPQCRREFVLRAHSAPTLERIAAACGCAMSKRLRS